MSKKHTDSFYPKGPVTDPENPEWTEEDVKNALPWEAMSDLEKSVFKKARGRPPILAPKKLVSLRLDADVLEALEASGPGWRARANQELVARLRTLLGEFPRVSFVKVAGHSGHPENERCDELARTAIVKRSPTRH